MTPTDYDLQLDVTIVDEDYPECEPSPLKETCSTPRSPSKTVEMPPVVLGRLVTECRG